MKTIASQIDVYRYRDAFTMFTEATLENFDFDQAVELVAEIEKTCESDYFLRKYKQQIVESAKAFVKNLFGNIYTEEDMAVIANKLGLDTAVVGTA